MKGKYLSGVKCDGYAVKNVQTGTFFVETLRNTARETEQTFLFSRNRRDMPHDCKVVPVRFEEVK